MDRHLVKKPVLFLILSLLLSMGSCASQDEELGKEIRKALEITKDTLEKTEDSPEKNYDPKVILMRAEAFYQEKRYEEALVEYQHFLDLHPLHEWASYSLFKLGMSYFRQIQTTDRDQEPTQKALETFQNFLSVYSDSEYAGKTKEMIKTCNEILAKNHLYIGRFYYKKEAYPAAIVRFEELLSSFPDQPETGDALYYLAWSYYQQEKPDQASSHLKRLLSDFPQTPYQKSARKLLDRIEKTKDP